MLENNTAPGYGVIPNDIIKNEIMKYISLIATKIKQKEEKREEIFKLAKETGIKQFLASWTEDVEEEDNSLNYVYQWAMPDGSVLVEHIPTF